MAWCRQWYFLNLSQTPAATQKSMSLLGERSYLASTELLGVRRWDSSSTSLLSGRIRRRRCCWANVPIWRRLSCWAFGWAFGFESQRPAATSLLSGRIRRRPRCWANAPIWRRLSCWAFGFVVNVAAGRSSYGPSSSSATSSSTTPTEECHIRRGGRCTRNSRRARGIIRVSILGRKVNSHH